MNRGAVASIAAWLIRDTFRQSVASRIFWLMLVLNVLSVLVCFSIRMDNAVVLKGDRFDPNPRFIRRSDLQNPDVQKGYEAALRLRQVNTMEEHLWKSGVQMISGQVSFGFGAVTVDLPRDCVDGVQFLHVILSKWVAGTAGLLLAIVWTAGFLPTFLEPSAATVLLAKPAPRWLLLTGKFVGVLVFAALQGAFFILGTWVALGLRTDVWRPEYLLSLPLLMLSFTIIYSVSTLLAVWTRSTVACVFGAIFAWLVFFAMNYGRHAFIAWPLLTAQPQNLAWDKGLEASHEVVQWAGKAGQPIGLPEAALPPVASFPPPPNTNAPMKFPRLFTALVETCYWVIPKPADIDILLQQSVGVTKYDPLLTEYQAVIKAQEFNPVASILSSLGFAVLMLALASWEFAKLDY